MNRLKSHFVVLLLTTAILLGAYSIYALLTTPTGPHLSWLGAGISATSVAAFFCWLLISSFVFKGKQARTAAHVWPVMIGVLVGIGVSIYGAVTLPGIILPLVYAVSMGVGWGLYEFWYSVYSDRDKSVLSVGKALPAFSVEDENGNSISSKDFKGHKTLILFYRGNWCPLCMAQIREVADAYRELKERGVNVNLISPQPQGHTQKLAGQFDAPMTFLVDKENAAAKTLGIFHQSGVPTGMQALGYDSDTVMPTVLITDERGKILFADLTDNYRVRPEPETFLRILDETV